MTIHGSFCNFPSLMIRIRPALSVRNMRPSGANAIAQGVSSPEATTSTPGVAADSESAGGGRQRRLAPAKSRKRTILKMARAPSVPRDLLHQSRQDLIGIDIFRFGLEIEDQAMAQRRIDHRLDILITHVHPAIDQGVPLGSQDDRLGAARARAEAQILMDRGDRIPFSCRRLGRM